MADAAPSPSEPSRFAIRLPRPLWIGVATVVVVVVGLGLRFGLPIYRQHLAIQEIERAGGGVGVEERGPEWLRARLGDERMATFGEVTAVYLAGSQATDATLAHLKLLASVEFLTLDNTHVTDAGMHHLRGLTKLKELTLVNTKITDAGLALLMGLRDLEHLALKNTAVTEGGVAELRRALPKVMIFSDFRSAGPPPSLGRFKLSQ
jgi:hypothetical protein